MMKLTAGGGWPKNLDFARPLSPAEQAAIVAEKEANMVVWRHFSRRPLHHHAAAVFR